MIWFPQHARVRLERSCGRQPAHAARCIFSANHLRIGNENREDGFGEMNFAPSLPAVMSGEAGSIAVQLSCKCLTNSRAVYHFSSVKARAYERWNDEGMVLPGIDFNYSLDNWPVDACNRADFHNYYRCIVLGKFRWDGCNRHDLSHGMDRI